VRYNSATVLGVEVYNSDSTYVKHANDVSQAIPFTIAANDTFEVHFELPILGWSSSQVMSSDADTRVVDFAGAITSSQSLTANVTDIQATIVKDSHSAWGGSSYSVKVPGDYIINGVLYTSSASPTIRVYKNGSPYKLFLQGKIGEPTASTVLLPNLVTSDVISLRADVTSTLSASTEMHLSLYRLSGPAQIAASESVSALYRGTPTGTLNSSENAVIYGTKIKDSHNAYNVSTGVYTVPVSGVYSIQAEVYISCTAAVNNNSELSINIDGTGQYYGTVLSAAGQTSARPSVSVHSVPLLAGQLVIIKSDTTTTTPSYAAGTSYNFFSIVRTGNY
jgi:hypothetical protein